jgi:hypothetical protein
MEPRGCNRRQSTANHLRAQPMVRRGSTVRVRQRACRKCLQTGTFSLSVRKTRGHIPDTFLVHATQRDVCRRLLTRLAQHASIELVDRLPANTDLQLSNETRS